MARKAQFGEMVGVRLTPDVREMVVEQAKEAGVTVGERVRDLILMGITVSGKNEGRKTPLITDNGKVGAKSTPAGPKKAETPKSGAEGVERRTPEAAEVHRAKVRAEVAANTVRLLDGQHRHAPPPGTARAAGTRAMCEGCGIPLERSNGMWLP